jgi:hypothetical protein
MEEVKITREVREDGTVSSVTIQVPELVVVTSLPSDL